MPPNDEGGGHGYAFRYTKVDQFIKCFEFMEKYEIVGVVDDMVKRNLLARHVAFDLIKIANRCKSKEQCFAELRALKLKYPGYY